MKVLFADDDSALRMFLHRALSGWGHEVLVSGDGAEALGLVESDPGLEVLILDWMMPSVSGIDVCRRLRGLEREHYTYVILLTSRSGKEAFLEGMSAGVDDFVTKPVDLDELRVRIHAAERVIRLKTEVQVQSAVSEQLREIDRMKTAFINVTSHELRSPLGIVGLILEMLSAKIPEDDDELKSILGSAMKSVERLTRISQETLKICHEGRYEKGLRLEYSEVGEVSREAVEEVMPFVRQRNQKVVVEVDPDVPLVALDREKIIDVLINLLMNSIRFTPDGETICLRVSRGGDDCVLFSVIDPGIGIPEEDKRHIFEPFFSSMDFTHHSSGKYEFRTRGIGLGLTIVKSFVEMHKGRVGFESGQGRGTRFHFEIPFQQ